MSTKEHVWTLYRAPAGLEAHGIHEGDVVSLSRQSERLIVSFEAPGSLLSSLGRSFGEIRGVFESRPGPSAESPHPKAAA
jgi:hypothetical protein